MTSRLRPARATQRTPKNPVGRPIGVANGAAVSGFCPVNEVVGRNAQSDTREALGGSRGVIVQSQVTIYRPAVEIYSCWRQLENLPRFMCHLEEVQDLGGNRSLWTAKGPLGTTVSWEAEIIRDVPPELISWRTLPGSEVVGAGSVWFRPAGGGHGTEVRVKLQYDPPAGKVGARVAWLLDEDAQYEIDEDLRRFKQLLETGEVSTGARCSSPRQSRHREGRATGYVLTDPSITMCCVGYFGLISSNCISNTSAEFGGIPPSGVPCAP
jgi:uncharacterized membrane protein